MLIDTPPVLAVSDPLTVATRVDGMILVCKANHTRIDALRHAAQAVRQGNIRLVGVVLNQLKDKRAVGYYGEYYGAEQAKPARQPGRGGLLRKGPTTPEAPASWKTTPNP